jgi:hypothetical protein
LEAMRGQFRDGVVWPDGPLGLPEGARVRIEPDATPRAAKGGKAKPSRARAERSLYERLRPLIGAADTSSSNWPRDASVNLDHYLYGQSKRRAT